MGKHDFDHDINIHDGNKEKKIIDTFRIRDTDKDEWSVLAKAQKVNVYNCLHVS